MCLNIRRYFLLWHLFFWGILFHQFQLFGQSRIKSYAPDSLFDVAGHYLDEKKFQEAIPLLLDLSQNEEWRKDPNNLRKTFTNIGFAFFYLDNYDSSGYYYDKAYDLALALGDSAKMMSSLKSSAMSSRNLGMFGRSLEKFQAALILANQLKDNRAKADLENSIGLVYFSLGDVDAALSYHQKSLTEFIRLGDSLSIAQGYNNLARCFQSTHPDSSLFYNHKALALKKSLGLGDSDLVNTLNNLGVGYLTFEDSLYIADKYIREAYEMHMKSKNVPGLATSFNNLVALSLKKNDLTTAKAYLDSGKILLEKLDLKELHGEHLALKTQYWEKMGNYEEALSAYKVLAELRSKLFEEEKLNVQHVEASFMLREEERQKELAMMEARIAKNESTRNFNLAIGFVVFTLVLGLLSGKLWHSLLTQMKLKNEISQKNEQIRIQQLDLKHRTRNLMMRIRSIIGEASANLQDVGSIEEFKRSERILLASALLEKHLYSIENLKEVPISSYLNDLLDLNREISQEEGRTIIYQTDLKEEYLLPSQVVLDCGMIVNELIVNSLKYAFPPEVEIPKILLAFEKKQDGYFELTVKDNGVGFKDDVAKGVGSWVIESLVIGLKAALEVYQEGGTVYKLKFKLKVKPTLHQDAHTYR